MSETKSEKHPQGAPEISSGTHRWNFWVCGSEAALFIIAAKMVGPMTLIPFLFRQLKIDDSWLALFSLSMIVMALAGPVGTALAGGMRYKLPVCVRLGFFQRLPFAAVPLGAMFLYNRPGALLVVLVTSWLVSHVFAGMASPIFQVVITNGVREAWWARMLSLRFFLGAIGGLVATGFVWWVNRRFEAPTNYIILGWAGVLILFVSLAVVSRIREVPMMREMPHGWGLLADTCRQMGRILRDDQRVRWIVLGRVFRAGGFLIGTYMTAVMIRRCGLTDAQMWIPFTLITVAEIVAFSVSGWIVDHIGPKPALVLSSVVTALNSAILLFADSLPAFALIFFIGVFGGSLLMNSWPTLILRLAPTEDRPAYFSTINLAAAPGILLVMMGGMAVVNLTGFDYVFYASLVGGVVSAVVFMVKLPHITKAPTG